MATVLVVDDHHLIRQAFVDVLKSLPQVGTVLEAAGGEDALPYLSQGDQENTLKVDLVLLDLGLKGSAMSGISLLRYIRKQWPNLPVMVVTASNSDVDRDEAMQAGASKYCLKSESSQELVEQILALLAGDVPQDSGVPDEVRKNCAILAQQHQITPARVRILELIAIGKGNQEIAKILELKEGTVKVQVSTLFKLLGVENRTEAMLLATQLDYKRSPVRKPKKKPTS